MSERTDDGDRIMADDVVALSSKLLARRPTETQINDLIDAVSEVDESLDVSDTIVFLSLTALMEAFVRRGWVTPGVRLGAPMRRHRSALVWFAIAKVIDRSDLQQILDAACALCNEGES